MSIAISSQIQLIQYFGEVAVNIADIGNINSVDTIYRVSGGAYQAWINGQPEASAFSTLDPGDGYLIISNTSSYTLDDGQNTESFPDATFITQPIEIRRHFGGSVDLDATTHNYKQIYKITDGAYSVWIQDSPANGFSSLENGETYLIFSLDSLTSEDYPYAFSTISQGEKVYITNYDNNSVDILDLSSKSLSGSITGLYYPTDIIVDSVKGLAYVAELSARTVAVIDLTTNTLKKRIPLNSKYDIAPDKLYKDGNLLYAMSSYAAQVAIVDLTTDQVEDYISSFELYSTITDAVKSGEEMYFVNSFHEAVYEVENKPGIQKFDNAIYPDFFFAEGGKVSCSDSGDILAFKVGRHVVKFYSRLGNDYVTYAKDFKLSSDYTIYAFEMSGDGKHFVVLYGSTSLNVKPILRVYTLNPIDHSWTSRSVIVSTDSAVLLRSMAINFDASSVFVSMLDTEFNTAFIQNYKMQDNQFLVNGSRLYQTNIGNNNTIRLVTNHSGETFAIANPQQNNSFIRSYRYDTSRSDFVLTGEIVKNAIQGVSIFGNIIRMNALGTKIITVGNSDEVHSFTYFGAVMGWLLDNEHVSVVGSISDISISNSGNTMVIGTPFVPTASNSYAGAFSVYTFSNKTWHLESRITGEVDFRMTGNGVSINGDSSIFFVSTFPSSSKLSVTPYHFSLGEFVPPPSTTTTTAAPTATTTTTAGPTTTTTSSPTTTTTTSAPAIEYTVTVDNDGSGNKFYINGTVTPSLTLNEGSTYNFDQSSPTNSTHPIRFSTTSDGTHGGGVEYTDGVTHFGTPGSAGAYTQFIVPIGAPNLYYYCANHSGMGGSITTS